ncbi:MAG: alcohol dehydrogenase [Acidimicrobiales bacterium]|nr:MAG: alcohol dehydrogenase [Acidimicrobiales bacterium]
MKALVVRRRPSRFAAAKLAGALVPGSGASVGVLELDDLPVPDAPGSGWPLVFPRLAGICGSDLQTVDAAASEWFEPIVSFPFVPGHEVVVDVPGEGRRVLEAVLGCLPRDLPPCPACVRGDVGACQNLERGSVEPGLQTGFCSSVGGGWSVAFRAHTSQLVAVPDTLSDEDAVMVEPTACAVHAVAKARPAPDERVVVIGAGTLGLLAVAAACRLYRPGHVTVAARYAHQKRWALEFGADEVCDPQSLVRVVRRQTGSVLVGSGGRSRLTSGADVVVDAVGSPESLESAFAVCRPRGRVVLLGMPGRARVDLTPLWHREITLVGAYAYGVEHLATAEPVSEENGSVRGEAEPRRGEGGRRSFDLALDLVGELRLGRLVSATYPLSRFREALRHAAEAGPRGAVKIAFDMRDDRERERLLRAAEEGLRAEEALR